MPKNVKYFVVFKTSGISFWSWFLYKIWIWISVCWSSFYADAMIWNHLQSMAQRHITYGTHELLIILSVCSCKLPKLRLLENEIGIFNMWNLRAFWRNVIVFSFYKNKTWLYEVNFNFWICKAAYVVHHASMDRKIENSRDLKISLKSLIFFCYMVSWATVIRNKLDCVCILIARFTILSRYSLLKLSNLALNQSIRWFHEFKLILQNILHHIWKLNFRAKNH